MKKILAALLVASFGAGLMAQNVVYDYKASIKRLDAQFSIKKESKTKAEYIAQSYKVASDTISGYIVLPLCTACNGDAFFSVDFQDKDNTDLPGIAYLIRKGDKLSKNNDKQYILVSEVDASAAIFGAYRNIQKKDDTTPLADIKAANKAWMWLDYAIPTDSTTIKTDKVLSKKNLGVADMDLGFLGLTNVGTVAGKATVYHTGFGSAKITGWSEAATLGWCGSTPGSEYSCQIVNAISGTLVGYPKYLGMCGATPMWDVCYNSTVGEGDAAIVNKTIVEEGAISGSWTLKYNKKVSQDYNAKATAAAKEAYIFEKLGSKSVTKHKINQNYKSSN